MILLICVCMPAKCRSSFFSNYLNTLGEVEGFVDTQQCDVTLLVGDSNVDFDRGYMLHNLLVDLMSELNVVVRDPSFRIAVRYTYERVDGLTHSSIYHLIISQS